MIYIIQEKIDTNTYIDLYTSDDKDFALKLLIGCRRKYSYKKYRLVKVI